MDILHVSLTHLTTIMHDFKMSPAEGLVIMLMLSLARL